jgi:YVTN family beta-propeller protein
MKKFLILSLEIVLIIFIAFSFLGTVAAAGQSSSPAGTYAYITNDVDRTVSVIDTDTNRVITTVDVGIGPSGVAISPDGKKVYVANGGDNTVSVVDTATNTVTATVGVGIGPCGVAVTPDGKKVYVGSMASPGAVYVIDTTTNKFIATVNGFKFPYKVAANPNGARVYVTNTGSDSLSVINTLSNTIIATIPVGDNPIGVAVSHDGKKVYVTNFYDNTVSVVNTATNTVLSTVNVGIGPGAAAVNPEGTKVYVTNSEIPNSTVSIIDTSTNAVVATVEVGDNPVGVSFTPDGKRAYITNHVSDNISVIDTATNKVIATVTAGMHPASFGQFIGYVPQRILPIANFNTNTTSGSAPLSVQFTDLSENATGVSWDFDNNGVIDSTDQNPVYTYATQGIYTVNLTASNKNGFNSKLFTITVLEKQTPPDADFSATPISGNAPLKVKFTSTSTGSPTEWKWSFGDGSALVTEQNPEYTYTTPGVYTVKHTAVNAYGRSTEIKTNYITVGSASPNADFSASTTSGNAPLTVKFTDKSTGSPTAWKWSFGDGSALVTQYNPTYTYSKPGTYTVKETVSNAAGKDTEIKTNYITVKTAPLKAPVAAFTASPTSGKKPLKVQFTDKSTNSPTSWKWSFGDGTYSTSKSPSHTYSKAGKYTASLTVKNSKGSNTKTASGYITVK